MLALVAALSITLDLGQLLQRNKPVQAPAVTCGIKTVSYRFLGTAGREFRYAGETYSLPAGGSIELIAEKQSTTYQIDGRTLQLELFPIDEFGSRTITLPTRQ